MSISLQAVPVQNAKTLPSLSIDTRASDGTKLGQDAIKAKAREKAQEFETVFLATMFDQMFQGISTEAPFGGGQAEQTYRSFLNNEYASSIASSGGVGIADQIYTEILKMQEVERA